MGPESQLGKMMRPHSRRELLALNMFGACTISAAATWMPSSYKFELSMYMRCAALMLQMLSVKGFLQFETPPYEFGA